MASKKSTNKVVTTLEKEDVTLAVIIADLFYDRFGPICENLPTCLLPLVNQPLLNYTLNCLSNGGIKEAFVFCCYHTELIKQFIKDGSWPGLNVTVVVSEGCRSLGDAMRDLDAKALIKGDFVLLTGHIVGNLQFKPILEKHKLTTKEDKGAVMTLVYKGAGRRLLTGELTVAMDTETQHVLMHHKKRPMHGKVPISMELLLAHKSIDVRCDLMDTMIAVCSVAVPPLFSDNFDFQSRDDFVRGLLLNEEILASTLYCHLLYAKEYALSVESWADYQHVSHDMIHRWIYPCVPDTIIENPYSYGRKNIYIQEPVTLKTCDIDHDVVIAKGTVIDRGAKIVGSVIGERCYIGEGVVIMKSFIFNDVKLERGANVSFSVIGDNCTVKAGASVVNSCIVGPGVVIDGGLFLTGLRLQAKPNADSGIGLGERLHLYRPGGDSVDSDAESGSSDSILNPAEGANGLRVDGESETDGASETETEEEVSRPESPSPDDVNLFFAEVVDSLTRGLEEHLPCDNLVLEVNSSRYAYNVTLREVNFQVTRAVLSLASGELGSRLNYFLPLLSNYVRSRDSQTDCLNAIEDMAGSHEHVRAAVLKLLKFLYEKDVLGEAAILAWYKNPAEVSEEAVALRKLVAPFIKWLEEAEEETESD